MTDNAKLESKQDHTALSGTRIGSGSTSLELTEGAAVESRHRGQTKWYSGAVDQVNGDGSYAVLYDDGDKEPEVRRYRIRRKGDEAASDYECNEEVDVRYGGGKILYAGKIAKVHDDGTYDIKYADGDTEQAVAIEMIFGRFRSGDGLASSTNQVGKSPGAKAASAVSAVSSPTAGTATAAQGNNPSAADRADDLSIGTAVEARCASGKAFVRDKWFEGTVEAVVEKGVYAITFDDGDKEPEVRRYRIRRKGDEAAAAYEEEEEVDARHGGGKKLYAGRVLRVNDDGTYDIGYADGDTEQAVAKEMVFGRFRSGGGLSISNRQVDREGSDEQKRQAEAEVVKGRQQLAEQKATNEAEARKESERLLANVASDALQKVADAIKQLAEGATSLE
jgi:hypothetical protein